ncbi:FimV/HubP family polar landmark protein [Pseudomonas zhanjiangensis]|uniref:FimV/HubP family polar landmark protein n=1 Tax=Pseudomonas zhanjiangensis TaxID=3239015 RepID=A0ABV3YS05_9PSED
MTRVQQWLLGLASSSAFYSGVVPALGLGEITLHSALNQPLEAEIELLQVADLSASDLSVRLAPAEVFSRAGVDRLVFLNDLRFTPLLRGSTSVIRVVSNQPVREPYLNFIVEVARPNGQLLREYTVLLDPPGSSAYRALATVPAAPAAPVRTSTLATPAVQPAATHGQRYRVVAGDSLWKIAARLRAAGSEASQHALMGDILALNPQAFSNGDSSQLRLGADLLLPDSAGVAAAPPVEPQLVAAAPAAPAPEPIDSQVEMLAQAQQRVDQELAEQAAENTQLQQGLAELQAQLQQLQAQMSDKDRQLAELQAQLAARETLPQASQASEAPVPVLEAAPATEPASGATGGWRAAGVAALAALLAAILGLVWRGRRQAEQPARHEPQLPEVAASEAGTPQPSAPVAPAPVAAPVVATPAAKAPAAPVVVPGDALEGANIYIAFGRLGEAAAALRKALQANPQRSDIRFRLLEVLAQQGDAQAFAREEAILRAAGFTAARIDQLKARHPELSALNSDPLENAVLELDETAPLAGAEAMVEDDFQLNLDDLSLDADWDLVSPFTPGGSNKADSAPDSFADAPPLGQPDAAELDGDRDPRNPFAKSMLVEETTADGWLQEGQETGEHALVGDEATFLDDLDQLAGSQANLIKLNQALAYIEQGNLGSACDMLNEVINDGDDQQKQQARKLLARIA